MTSFGGNESNWIWTWRKDGVHVGDAWIQLGLKDTGGPPAEAEGWAPIRSQIHTLAREIYWLDVVHLGPVIALAGSVASERAKAVLNATFARMTSTLRNNLEVAAAFESASDDDDEPSASEPEGENHVSSITRFPSITPRSEARAGQAFRFDVDLGESPDPSTNAKPVQIIGLPEGWSSVQIGVEIYCSEIVFDDTDGEVGVIVVSKNGSATTASFNGRIKDDVLPDKPFRLKVTFDQDGRPAGWAVRYVSVEPLQVGGARPGPTSPAVVASGTVELKAEVSAATLRISIYADSEAGSYLWRVSTPRGIRCDAPGGSHKIVLGADVRGYARKILRQCPSLKAGERLKSSLRGIGEEIWLKTPSAFKDFYAEMRARYGSGFPIQIITEEHYVPWELMHPTQSVAIPDPHHLCITHPIARWFGEEETRLNSEFARGGIASFVPKYPSGKTSLPAALEEGRRLVEEFGAVAHEATYAGFTGFWSEPLPDEKIAVLHFAGHAASPLDNREGNHEGLRMVDDWVSATEVHSGVRLGNRDGTLVILNACCAGTADEMLGAVSGWPARLAERSFGGVLAPIWAVQDEHASNLVIDYLEGMLKGKTLGVAMRDARAFHSNASGTPYAYQCHGDVMARMDRGSAS
ncbi:CHAT domain-containing protein [Methylobacterium sp. E-041]|uniref:CHAT domain-containing protein n=1 Tax=Methylobacterium sp. E-041 TaxID=2836573 RepID=UPI001FBADBF0|nr:CHAT domain-containing protein [Methylobacterium sp. E-041]MCJ2105529.1 CHAT domain-containing protein [Methylobacterium sp. E-041]